MAFRRHGTVASAIAISAALVSVPAYAQSSGASESEVIIVTATKREQTLQEVPVAVSVIGGDFLDSTGVSGVEQITEAVPSVTFNRGNNESNSSFNVRGIGTSVFSPAVEPSVSTVFDDVVMARSGQGFQDFIDVQRVEVLRGPQSTLFGKNASAGVVSVTTKDPSDVLSGDFDAMYAEGNEYQVRGSISAPLSDTTGFRLSGFYKNFDGITKNYYNGDEYNGWESWGFRGKLKFEPSSNLTIKLIGDYRDSESSPVFTFVQHNNPAIVALIDPVVPSISNTDVNVDLAPLSTSTQWGAQANVEYTFDSDWTVTSISAFRNWKYDNEVDVDATPLGVGGGGLPFAWTSNFGANDLDQFSQELRLASPDLGGFDLLFGAFAYKLDFDRYFQRGWAFAGAAEGDDPVYRSGTFTSNTKTTNLAGFASGNIYLGDATIFGGIRYLHEKLEYTVLRDPTQTINAGDLPLLGAAGTAADFGGTFSDNAITGNIGARYDFGIGNVYASYSRGYKGRGINVAFASLPGSDPLDAENVDSYEVGLKLETDDRTFSLNAALFYTKYQNFQSQSQRPGDITFELRNAGDISTRGLEVESVIRPNDLLQIRLSGTFMDAKIDDFPLGPCYVGQTAAQGCVGGVQDLSGSPLTNAPDVRLAGFVKQYIPLGDSSPIDAFVQTNYTYQSEVQWQLDQNPLTAQEGYGILNLAAGIEHKDGDYALSVFVRNVTDVNQPGSLTFFNFAGGAVTAQPQRNQERYWGVQGRYSF